MKRYKFSYVTATLDEKELVFDNEEEAEEVRRMYMNMGAIVSEIEEVSE